MAINDLWEMAKADRYTADGREAIAKAREADVEDRIYQIGEISQKTGLQKTAEGWVKPKSGNSAGGAKKEEKNYRQRAEGEFASKEIEATYKKLIKEFQDLPDMIKKYPELGEDLKKPNIDLLELPDGTRYLGEAARDIHKDISRENLRKTDSEKTDYMFTTIPNTESNARDLIATYDSL